MNIFGRTSFWSNMNGITIMGTPRQIASRVLNRPVKNNFLQMEINIEMKHKPPCVTKAFIFGCPNTSDCGTQGLMQTFFGIFSIVLLLSNFHKKLYWTNSRKTLTNSWIFSIGKSFACNVEPSENSTAPFFDELRNVSKSCFLIQKYFMISK